MLLGIATALASCSTAVEHAATGLVLSVDGETPLAIEHEGYSRDDEYWIKFVIPDEAQRATNLEIGVLEPVSRTNVIEFPPRPVTSDPEIQPVIRFDSDGCSYSIDLLNLDDRLSAQAYVSCNLDSAPSAPSSD